MQERDIKKAFDGVTPDKELKEKVLEAIDRHEPRKFNWDFSRIVPVALCAVVLINGIVLFKSLPEKNNSVIPLDLSSTNISNNMVVDITTTSIPVTGTTVSTDGFAEFNCDYTKGDIVMKMPPDFLDEDAKRLFNEASYIWEKAHLSFYLVEIPDIPDPIWEGGFLDSDRVVEIDNRPYVRSGVSYQSFYNYLTSIFTESYTNEDFPMENNRDVNGELCVWGVKDGTPHIVSGREYELISQTDSRIEFKSVNYYRADEVFDPGVSKEEYKAKYPDFPFEWTTESTFVMIKTENGWRFEEFSWWNEETVETDITETTTEPVIEKKLNLDLLSDMELTYSQLEEKYGKQVSVFYENSTMYYVFENSSYAYGWSYGYDGDDFLAEERVLSFPFSQNVIRYDLTQEEAPIPKAETGCSSINDINCRDLFLGINESSSFSEIEEIYGVRWFKTYPIDGGRSKGWEAYVSPFYYDSIGVYIFTKEEGKIDLDSYASISFK